MAVATYMHEKEDREREQEYTEEHKREVGCFTMLQRELLVLLAFALGADLTCCRRLLDCGDAEYSSTVGLCFICPPLAVFLERGLGEQACQSSREHRADSR